MGRRHGGTKGRRDGDRGLDWFDASEPLRASGARARSSGVEDDLVGYMERIEALLLGADDESVHLRVRGRLGAWWRTRRTSAAESMADVGRTLGCDGLWCPVAAGAREREGRVRCERLSGLPAA